MEKVETMNGIGNIVNDRIDLLDRKYEQLEELKEQLQLYEEELQKLDDKAYLEIIDAKDEATGKLLYSNDTRREIALREKQGLNPDWMAYKQKQRAAVREILRLDHKIECIRLRIKTELAEAQIAAKGI